jgi:hypothetical protein
MNRYGKQADMKTFEQLIAESLEHVEELFPWDLAEKLEGGADLMLMDIRQPYEYDAMHIEGALNVPRGILETACEYERGDRSGTGRCEGQGNRADLSLGETQCSGRRCHAANGLQGRQVTENRDARVE